MTVGEFKFRANDDWSYNYGSDEADGNLGFDGSNIPVEVEGDYAITLDLSAPHAYTYSANRWGIIGNATPGGWDADTFMSWDTEAEVFTVTADLMARSEEHTSELQSRPHLVCRLLLEKKKKKKKKTQPRKKKALNNHTILMNQYPVL